MFQMPLQWETHRCVTPHWHLHLLVSTNNTSNNNNPHTLHIITQPKHDLTNKHETKHKNPTHENTWILYKEKLHKHT
jgi:hypothetical protein